MARSFGYNVKILEKENTTYDKVTEALKKYKPRVYIHFGHGCKLSLQGNQECILTRKFNTDQLIDMAQGTIEEREKLLLWLNPLGKMSCPGICKLDDDPCSPLCLKETNVGLLKDTISIAIACHSASQLGICAVQMGCQTYTGETDLLMFPVDSLQTQNVFGDIQLVLIKELLMGRSVGEAEIIMGLVEDQFIRDNKQIKYMSLPMLWDKIHRRILGDKSATIYQ